MIDAATYNFNLGTYSNYKIISSDLSIIGSTGSGLSGSFTLDGVYDGDYMWITKSTPFIVMPKPSGGGGGGLPVMAGLQAWFKGDAGITTSGGYITTWTDQSANALIASASNSYGFSTSLTVGTSLNGIPSVSSTSQDNLLLLSSDIALTNYTIFIVANQTSSGNDISYILQRVNQNSNTGGMGIFLGSGYGGPGPFMYKDGGAFFVGGSNITGSAQYLTYNYNDSTGAAYIKQNGSQVASSSSGSLVYTINSILSGFNPGSGFNGRLYEVIIYNTSLSAGDVTSMESYLTTKYGL